MDSKIPTSFIPKETIRTDLRPRTEPTSILTIIALLLLAGSLIYLAGIYVYRYMIYKQVNDPCTVQTGGTGQCGLKATFELETKELDRSKLESLKQLDTKLKNGAGVLDRHVALKPLFEFLGRITNQNIQYQKFQFDKTGVTINGVAKSYEDIAYQQKIFATDPEAKTKILNFAFSDFDLDPKGQVSFKLTFMVDNSLLQYVNSQTQTQ